MSIAGGGAAISNSEGAESSMAGGAEISNAGGAEISKAGGAGVFDANMESKASGGDSKGGGGTFISGGALGGFALLPSPNDFRLSSLVTLGISKTPLESESVVNPALFLSSAIVRDPQKPIG